MSEISKESWSVVTMHLINKLTPEIKGKAFEPEWFLLRQRLEQYEAATHDLRRENDKLRSDCEALRITSEML